jgi:type 1 glutamine amidotransferase
MIVTYKQDQPYPWLHADSLANYDVMLAYTTNQNATQLTQGQLAALTAWIASGRVMVAMHGTTNTFINNSATITAAWRALLGAQYTGHGPRNDGGMVSLTTAGNSHASLTGTTMLPTSALNTGGSPYWDEGREHINFVSDTVVLARCQTTVNLPWIWVRPQGNGWVYYNASGHDGQVWARSEFKGQIVRALTWGYQVKQSYTGLRGRAPSHPFLSVREGRLTVPFRGMHSVEVLDMKGRRVLFHGPSSDADHDLSSLPVGTYGVRLHPERGDALRALMRVE